MDNAFDKQSFVFDAVLKLPSAAAALFKEMLSFLGTTCSETPLIEYQIDGTTLFIADKRYGLTDNNISASLALSTRRSVISAHTGRTVFNDCT